VSPISGPLLIQKEYRQTKIPANLMFEIYFLYSLPNNKYGSSTDLSQADLHSQYVAFDEIFQAYIACLVYGILSQK
jgi:hypothetical protein